MNMDNLLEEKIIVIFLYLIIKRLNDSFLSSPLLIFLVSKASAPILNLKFQYRSLDLQKTCLCFLCKGSKGLFRFLLTILGKSWLRVGSEAWDTVVDTKFEPPPRNLLDKFFLK